MERKDYEFYSHVSRQFYDRQYEGEESQTYHSYAHNFKEHMQKKRSTHTEAISKEELEKIFWGKLAPLGWKKDETTFVFPCTLCDEPLSVVGLPNKDNLDYMQSKVVIMSLVNSHKCPEVEA